METKSTRPPTKRKVKSVGFKDRPYVTARIRAELVGGILGITYTQAQKKMSSIGYSIRSLEDCIKFVKENREYGQFTPEQKERVDAKIKVLTKKAVKAYKERTKDK